MSSTRKFESHLLDADRAPARRILRTTAVAVGLALLGPAAIAQFHGYVAANARASLAVVDTGTGATLASIPVGDAPAHVALSPDGSRAYAANTLSDSISVIDAHANTVLATIAVSDAPASSVATLDGQHLYVSTAGGVVELVDLQSNTVVQSIATGGNSGSLAIAPDGSRVYHSGGSIAVIDTTSNTVVASFAVNNYSSGIAVSPDGSRLYVANTIYNFSPQFSAGGGVAVFDTATYAQIASINTWYIPNAVALSPDGAHLFVGLTYQWVNTGYGAGFLPTRWVSDIDTNSSSVVASTLMSNQPAGMAFALDGSSVFVAVRASNVVSVIDAASHAIAADIAVAGGPVSIALAAAQPAAPTAYCTAGLTSSGCTASIAGVGTPSASATSGFTISASNVEGDRSGLIFYGVSGRAANPWSGQSSSFLCVHSPTQRTAVQNSGGASGTCDGVLALDFAAYRASHPAALGQPMGAGLVVDAQAWFRDPLATTGTNLSNALEFTLEP